ncbi:MAG: phosphatase PAP2 family protein, partial [Terracidiphilus sp.]
VRPLLVFALTLNLFFGYLLTVLMGREGGLLPMKYDYILFHLDTALGVHAAWIARPLQGAFRIPLRVVYELMVPMMILWIPVTTHRSRRGSVVLAYVAELVVGPLLYALVPACGPLYAFRARWLQPPPVHAVTTSLAGLPNSFPSLHLATALVLVFFAPGRIWRAVSLAFLAATAMATLSTGEHYVIDLFAGMAFGCFAAFVGRRKLRHALFFFGVALFWSLAARFGYGFLIAHPTLVRVLALATAALAAAAVFREWKTPALANEDLKRSKIMNSTI